MSDRTPGDRRVPGDDARSRVGSFLLGGLIGGLAGFAASRLRNSQPHTPGEASDLRAFEAAPCFDELRDAEPERHEPAR